MAEADPALEERTREAPPKPERIIEHPNRESAASKTTRVIVIALLVGSAFTLAIITIGGWDVLTAGRNLQIIYIGLYLVLAFYVSQWRSGMLPLTAALAAILCIFAVIGAPAWFARDADGFTDPLLNAGILGMLTVLTIPLQLLLIAFAMRGFSQAWNVEVERLPDGSTRSTNAFT
jgi:hypothetical protein